MSACPTIACKQFRILPSLGRLHTLMSSAGKNNNLESFLLPLEHVGNTLSSLQCNSPPFLSHYTGKCAILKDHLLYEPPPQHNLMQSKRNILPQKPVGMLPSKGLLQAPGSSPEPSTGQGPHPQDTFQCYKDISREKQSKAEPHGHWLWRNLP